MKKFYENVGKFFIWLALMAFMALILGVFVMLVWNWIMPLLFGLATISFIEGWGVAFLCGMLFKGRGDS